jgi:hypothetical protein
VATPIGCTARAIRACPSTSSGLVGSSIHLVRVEHESALGTDLFADDPAALEVGRGVAADLELEVRPSLGDGRAAPCADRLLVIADPAGAGHVGRVAVSQELGLPLAAARKPLFEHREGGLRRQRVGDVAKVDGAYDLGRGEVGQVLPEWLSRPSGQEVPHGVHDRGGCQMDHPLLRAEPA